MDPKALLETVRREVQSALTKTFDKVEEFSKVQRLRLKISSVRGDIKDIMAHVGEYIYQHKDDFKEFPVLDQNIKRMEALYASIEELKKEMEEIREAEKTDVDD